MSKRVLMLNSLAGIICQIANVTCGLILPGAILRSYGADQYGLTNSISNFLGFISLCEAGMGTVVQSSLYKPLAADDMYGVSCIMKSSRRFFNSVGLILLGYVVTLCVFYPHLINEFGSFYVIAFILILSINSFTNYFLGICCSLLLYADKKAYIPLGLQAISTIISTIVSVLFIDAGASLLLVKFLASVLFLLRPILMNIYVRRRYNIDWNVCYVGEPINQKWNGVAQHVASVVVDRTDVIVLTLFSNLQAVSIYGVYSMVVSNIRGVIESALSGMQAEMGDLYFRNETCQLNVFFGNLEWAIHAMVVFLYTCTGILIVPFVAIYTRGVDNVDFNVPFFSALIVIAFAGFSIQTIYKTIVKSAGHYKQTQGASVIEAAINVVASIALVRKFGLSGVAIGTILAMSFRLIYHVVYIHKNIIFRSYRFFLKQICVDFISVVGILAASEIVSVSSVSYLMWIVSAVQITLLAAAVIILVNFIFYRKTFLGFCNQLVHLVLK